MIKHCFHLTNSKRLTPAEVFVPKMRRYSQKRIDELLCAPDVRRHRHMGGGVQVALHPLKQSLENLVSGLLKLGS